MKLPQNSAAALSGKFTYYFEVHEEVENAVIFPFLIQVFVENAAKHALTLEKVPLISVTVYPEDRGDEKYVNIYISDTGNGFPEETLQRLKAGEDISEHGKHIGIENCLKRFRYYYGDNMFINTAEEISGIPASWPRYNLEVGAAGDKVRQIQEQLARISQAYPAIPTITPDGIYGEATRAAVEKFQSIFGLPVTGVVDYRTWYKISEIYVAVTRIAELV